MSVNAVKNNLEQKIARKKALIGVIGLGYVGLPLVLRFCEEGFRVLGFDVDGTKVKALAAGKSYIKHIESKDIKKHVVAKRFSATSDMRRLKEPDAIIICVPTPLNKMREPDMSYVVGTTETIANYLRKGQIVSLESTTYPGTTDEILLPAFENKGFRVGKDFFLTFSPEREDPGRTDYCTKTIAKVVGGVTPDCLDIGHLLYSSIIDKVVKVTTTRAAEMTKLLENIYRSVNIALVNELKMLCDKMNIDIWEVIEAAKSKPFGFQAFYPGPGLGGHCIPIDPFYLTWKAREFEFSTRFIELAGEINTAMPAYVVGKTMEALNAKGKSLNGARVLVLGAAYKKDVDDMRESPSLHIIELLNDKGAKVSYNDPYVPKLPKTRKYSFEMKSVPLTKASLGKYDCVVIATDHTNYDYKAIVAWSRLVVDARGTTRGIKSQKIVKA